MWQERFAHERNTPSLSICEDFILLFAKRVNVGEERGLSKVLAALAALELEGWEPLTREASSISSNDAPGLRQWEGVPTPLDSA
jgi:hypothetical protein